MKKPLDLLKSHLRHENIRCMHATGLLVAVKVIKRARLHMLHTWPSVPVSKIQLFRSYMMMYQMKS